MSSKKDRAPASGSANPAAPGSLTPAQFQEWSWALKKISDNKLVVPAVLIAGLAGAFEIIHLLFLAGRFLFHWIGGTWFF
jgi:hypothetical protein